MASIPYSSAASCLMYAMVPTRLDVSYGIGVVNKYMENPGK